MITTDEASSIQKIMRGQVPEYNQQKTLITVKFGIEVLTEEHK